MRLSDSERLAETEAANCSKGPSKVHATRTSNMHAVFLWKRHISEGFFNFLPYIYNFIIFEDRAKKFGVEIELGQFWSTF